MAVNIGPQIGIQGEAEYRRQINNIIQQSKTLGSAMDKVTAGFDKNASAQDKARSKAVMLTKQVEAQKERVKLLNDMLEKSVKELGENDTKTLKWKQAVNEATTQLTKMENELKDVAEEAYGFQAKIDKAKESVKKFGDGIKSGLKSAVDVGVKSFGALTTAAATTIVGLGKIGVEYNMEMESYTTNFETMLGSAEAAEAKVESLKEMAANTPFEMAGLADATQQLLAMNVASEDTNKFLQQLGDISLGDSQKLDSLVNAFGKMSSTGKVTLENINMMAEQGFNPLNEIAKVTGETMTELYDRVSAGEVSFDEIKMAMENATTGTGQFAGGMERASKTMQGQISTLKDNAVALVGEVFQPITESIQNDILPMGINAIDELTTAFREDGVNGMIDAAGEIIGETIGIFTESLPQFADSAVGMVGSLLSGIRNNLGSISNGASQTVITLIKGLTSMIPDIVVTGVMLIGQLAVGLVQAIPDLIMAVPEIIEGIVQGFSENADEFAQMGQDVVDGIWEGILSGWDELVDWFNGLWDSSFSDRTVNLNVNRNVSTYTSSSGVVHGGGGGSFSAWSVNGSHAGGLNYVPFDGYLAELHRGEMVLTRREADVFRNAEYMNVSRGGSVSGAVFNFGGFNFEIYTQEGQNPNEIADAVMDRIQTVITRKVSAVGTV